MSAPHHQLLTTSSLPISLPQAPIHVSGHSTLLSVQHEQPELLLANEVELYADDQKAIVWITTPDHPDARLVFREPKAVAATTLLMRAMARMNAGSVLNGASVLCPVCLGAGWIAPSADCTCCCGRGYQSLNEEPSR